VVNRSTGSISQGAPAPADAAGADILNRLADLEQLLNDHREQVTAYDGAKRDVADLRDEVTRTDQDTDRIGDTLRRLTARVGSITVLATAADKLAEAVRVLF
jgi:hypothetical protein